VRRWLLGVWRGMSVKTVLGRLFVAMAVSLGTVGENRGTSSMSSVWISSSTNHHHRFMFLFPAQKGD